MGVNERISQARKDKKWTQKDLADALKVNLKNVSRWELGSSAPSFDAAIQLARVLNVSLDFLGGLDTGGGKDGLSTLFNSKVNSFSKEQATALKTILNSF